jgi:hypothetical protein
MYTLIATTEQVAQLRKGDLLTKYYGNNETLPDTFDKKNSILYRINKINPSNQMIELIGAADPFIILFSPGRLNRMFIQSANLVREGGWWLPPQTINA